MKLISSRKVLLLFLLFVFVPLESKLYSQSLPKTFSKQSWISFSAGITNPTAPERFVYDYKAGLLLSGYIELPVAKFASAGLQADMNYFPIKQNLVNHELRTERFILIGINLFGKLQSERVSFGKFSPYLKGGIGVHFTVGNKYAYSARLEDFSGTKKAGLILSGAAGMNFSVREDIKIFLEGIYRINKAMPGFDGPIDLQTINLCAGISLRI